MITCNAGTVFPLSSPGLAASRLQLWFVTTRPALVRHFIKRPRMLRAMATILSPLSSPQRHMPCAFGCGICGHVLLIRSLPF